ncbi:MAG: aspartate ammonia-lyase [Alcaligenes sp.]
MTTDIASANTRLEKDLLGARAIPDQMYFGVHTLRAVENFDITGTPISSYPDLVRALAQIKASAAQVNHALGALDAVKKDAIVQACREIEADQHHDQFVVDVIQGGAGTSTNMNANEVIANRALEILGHERGQYTFLHPNEDVNLSQSTNDVYPTALKLAAYQGATRLLAALEHVQHSFERKAQSFKSFLKMGRTQLQEAVPMSLGQEFAVYAGMIAKDRIHLTEVMQDLCEINLGATAIGTGINTDPRYAQQVTRQLSSNTGIALRSAPDLIMATQDCSAFVQLSSALKRIATTLSKTCNDLRLLSSGPRAGMGEINLPARQAGSSIMPGKVNPVIPEAINQIAFEVFGNDVTVTFAAEAGQLQLNAFEPIIAHSLYKSLRHLQRGCMILADHCVEQITANPQRLADSVNNSIGLVTALNPLIGYAAATDIAKQAHETGKGVAELILEQGLLSQDELAQALQPESLIAPRASHVSKKNA